MGKPHPASARAPPSSAVPIDGSRSNGSRIAHCHTPVRYSPAPRHHSRSANSICFQSSRFDLGAAALFDEAADPYLSAGERLEFKACRREVTISLQDRNGEIFAPASSEIHVDGGAALVH